MAELVGELAHDEVFGQIVFETIEAAHLVEHGFAGGDGRAEREFHAFQQARDQHATQKLRVHPDRFQLRPEPPPRYGSIRTGHHAYTRVCKLRCESGQHVGTGVDVAIAHE